jgi:hypothetical protein
MNVPVMLNLSDEDVTKLREAELKRRRDEREQRIAEQVARVEQEVRALRVLVDKGARDAH